MKSAVKIVPLVLAALAVLACAPATVKDKKVVQISFKGTLADGSVFGQTEDGKPLEFIVGAGRMIPALEKALVGMKVGEKKTVQIKAADAYGEYDPSAVQQVPRAQFPKDVAVGSRDRVQTPQGDIVVAVTALTATTATVDFNHPLAGKDLTFEVVILKIRDATKEELAAAFPEVARPAPGAGAAAQPAQQPGSK